MSYVQILVYTSSCQSFEKVCTARNSKKKHAGQISSYFCEKNYQNLAFIQTNVGKWCRGKKTAASLKRPTRRGKETKNRKGKAE